MELEFTDRELTIMNILWEEGSSTVHEARDILEADILYTSLLTVFQTLEEKGYARHEKEGRAYRYYPTVEREDAERSALSYVMSRVFKDSPERLMSRLLEERPMSPEEADELRGMLGAEGDG